MNLIVDIGNSTAKLAVMDAGRVVAQVSGERFETRLLDSLLASVDRPSRAIVCSTRDDAEQAADLVRSYVPHCMVFTPATPVPMTNAYLTPETLGRDRLAAAVGAAALWSGRNLLVVDFGTALTLDLVTADNTFRGGFISPGVQMRFRALHDYTARLPLCAPSEGEWEMGVTTESAIIEGVIQGLAYEIEGHIGHLRTRYGDLYTIFTGGDAKYFAKRIKNTIFANCNLVFCGLDRILEYNASE